MIKLNIVEDNVTSTFRFASKEELINTLKNVILGSPLTKPVVFSIEEVRKT